VEKVMKILLVDDALMMRVLLRGILEAGGYEVIAEAADGEDALALYRIHRPDVVTMDIVMPGQGGINAVRAIREADPEARVIMVSCVGQEELITEAMEAGALAYIMKPFKPDQVLSVMQMAEGAPTWT
jgi:two-component system chemotaxis response regulator CheY